MDNAAEPATRLDTRNPLSKWVAEMQSVVSMPNWLTSLQTLKEHSFDVTGLFPVSQDPALRVVEFDCVAVNAAFNRTAPPR